MTRIVVDASVAIKWFLPEEHSINAHRLLSEDYELLAPDLLWVEAGNALWKRHRRGQLARGDARGILRDLRRLPLAIHPSGPLIGMALDLAIRRGQTVYDSLYLAVAIARRCAMVTADDNLYQVVKDGPLSRHLVWVEDI